MRMEGEPCELGSGGMRTCLVGEAETCWEGQICGDVC